ncbi:serine/threonine-protein kinase bud32 [Alternaria rosae]|uniref:serine/threonine-protein kinase bud32 n=1 Tax=Alternaria rosae TaxID=1187941 RepID=UPI001E8DA187|nr:serine/threonine-protein kinase bud32 [Alternaria rosae]KAH6882979.1 serine/threonine-protein kinase bud32 [Alternaria rosae]
MAEPPVVPPIEPPPPPETSRPLHTLPAPFSQDALEIITQGAEALVYKTTFLTPHTPVVVKYRPPKPYRHPTLDKRLTKQRLLAEARSLIRVKRDGVNVPGVTGADWDAGWLVLEYVDGRTVRKVLDGWAHQVTQREKEKKYTETRGGETAESSNAEAQEGQEEILDLMRRVGREVGKLHELGVCHGDLTTSNIMLRTPNTLREAAMNGEEPPDLPPANPPQESNTTSLAGDIFLIDFGLTTASIQDEDKAVDLYVLERAFSATHPAAEPLFQEVLKAYGECGKGARGVLKRLEGVRLRGRKRSMLG